MESADLRSCGKRGWVLIVGLGLALSARVMASDAIPPAERYLQERAASGLPADPSPRFERPLPQGGVPGDEFWWDGFGPQQLDNTVLASTLFQGSLVIGGDFTSADGRPLSHVARWTGGGWESIGEGLNGSVFALAEWNGQLVAGGRFTASGTVGLARVAIWQDTTWAPLGAGFDGDVLALETIDSVLYAGGHFTRSGETATLRIAQWNGTDWIQPGAGFTGGATPFVNDITEFDGSILAAGKFTVSGTNALANVARWDGSQWVQFGTTNERVYALFEHEAQLYAGGFFTSAGGQSARYVARWTGSEWGPVGQGMDGSVLTFAAVDSSLYAGGLFHRAGGRVSDSVARLEGDSEWTSTSSGMNGAVVTLIPFEGDLIAGGIFSRAGGAQVPYISRFRGEQWNALSMLIDGPVAAMTVHQGRLIVGGTFQRADGITANGVAAWDGTRWSALGAGFDGPVQTLASFQGSLYAGGSFEHSDSVLVANLARWDGSSWLPVGTGPNDSVWALLSTPSRLLVGGEFTSIDGAIASRVAAFDGTTWSVVGPGLPGRVRALSTFADTAIVAGGDFNAGNLHFVAHLAQNEWRPLGLGTNGPVLSVQEFEGSLLAAGLFTEADSAAAPGIAVWDSLGWRAFAPSLTGTVNRLLVHGTSLFAGGDFQVPTVDLETARFLARYRNGVWSALGSGVDGVVQELGIYQDALYVGGGFSIAGDLSSPNIARWFDIDPVPVHLHYFEAERDGAIVRLRWGVSSAFDHAGFRLYRGDTSPEDALVDALIEPREDGEYEFLDRDAPRGEAVYWLEEVAVNGQTTLFGPIQAAPSTSAQIASLERIWPSPFRDGTSIRFSLGQSESITLSIHDAAGRRVATLLDGMVSAGPHEIRWDGHHEGRRLPPGLYFVSLSGRGWNESGRVLILR